MWPDFKLGTLVWRTKLPVPESLGSRKASSADSVKAVGTASLDLTMTTLWASLSPCWVMGELRRTFILVKGQMDKKHGRGETGRIGEVDWISKQRKIDTLECLPQVAAQ